MKILAIETATEACSVALVDGDQRLQRQEIGARVHAAALLPWIAELLAEAGLTYGDLDGVAVDRGPGGFTSIRLGLGVTQGIGLAHDLPAWPVSSLAALAHAARPAGYSGRFLAALDARMGEVYAGWFSIDQDRIQPIGAEILCPPGELKVLDDGPFIAAGNAFSNYGPELRDVLGTGLDAVQAEAWPTALAVADLALRTDAVAAHELKPIYLRDRVTG
ncbi:MAG TPA: tRNA (adenosine(37)-N6)-threonylcarbamoyltransferase complex dimerization subunit type 1 TsaB [Wenzhouxiangellaceae bacterium]|nr:tRNA (adenosine(37)-N6)-threonylcarbamoyltransferase complex dimerization subunit type 1 TsaB [Wenzhouxiangellaceae bacterium]